MSKALKDFQTKHAADIPASTDTIRRVVDARETAYEDAIRAVAKYKFWMFGYYAASWVKYNKLLKGTPWHQGNPFKRFVELGRIEIGELPDARPHERHTAKALTAQWGESMFDMDYDENEPAPTDLAQVPDNGMTYEQWERAVIDCLITGINVTNGDAQGIVQAQGGMPVELWEAGFAPMRAANAIDAASRAPS